MTRRRSAAATASLIGFVCSCAASTERDSKVTAIDPATAFNDAPFIAQIQGGLFRPTYDFDTMAAAAATEVGTFSAALQPVDGPATAAIPLGGVTWQSPIALTATVPAGVPAGRYDVVVKDPRGRRMQLDGGFVSLGPDAEAPVVTIDEPAPDTLIGVGTTVSVTLTADDGDGVLAALGASIATAAMLPIADIACNVPARTHKLTCHGEFVAPAPTTEDDHIIITPVAIDSVGNAADAPPTVLRLAPRPSLTGVVPSVGPANGGTEVIVQGTDFVDGTEILFGNQSVHATWISATEVHVVTPSHDPGSATLQVASGGAVGKETMFFNFVAAPIIRLVSPLSGPVTGGTPISIVGNYFRGLKTTIRIGGAPLLCQTPMGPNRIDGIVPASNAGVGTATIVADDAIGGISTAPVPFTYDDSPDGGVPTSCNAGGSP